MKDPDPAGLRGRRRHLQAVVVAIACCLVLAAAALTLLRGPSTADRTEVRSEAGGFSLHVPAGWVTTNVEPRVGDPVYLRSHEPVAFALDDWGRAGMWVSRWNADGVTSSKSGKRQPAFVDGREGVRFEYTMRPPGVVGRVPGVSVRVVEFFVVVDRRVYRFTYWSYPPHLSDRAIAEMVRTIDIYST